MVGVVGAHQPGVSPQLLFPAQNGCALGIDWDKLKAMSPDDAHGLMRTMLLAFIGGRAKHAKAFLAWNLRPNPIHCESRLARDDASAMLEE